MLKIGITGGIGSGKTTVCKLFELLDIRVYYADVRAKELMNFDPKLKSAIAQHFGSDIYRNGQLDRRRLSNIIFHDASLLRKINEWVHPAVAQDFATWCDQQTGPYILEEAAILFENGAAARFDKVILVTAPESLRIKRVCLRDAVETEAVQARINNQWPEKKKMKLADFVIHNDGKSMLLPQIMKIHHQLSAKS
jgi:dephospho-CoA kinase